MKTMKIIHLPMLLMLVLTTCSLISCGDENPMTEPQKDYPEPSVPKSTDLLRMTMRVDEETDLLYGVTLEEGISLLKIEFVQNDERTEVQDIKHFIPTVPGDATFFFTFLKRDTKVVVEKSIYIYAKIYNAPEFPKVNVVQDYREKYNSMKGNSGYWSGGDAILKGALAPFLPICYISREMYRSESIEFIILGEIPMPDCDFESIGAIREDLLPEHASAGWCNIRMMSPISKIKSCLDTEALEPYIATHPEKLFFISCASDGIGFDINTDQPQKTALRHILENDNVIVSYASGNAGEGIILNEICPKVSGDYLKIKGILSWDGASVNSKKNNKITVQGCPVKYHGGYWVGCSLDEIYYRGCYDAASFDDFAKHVSSVDGYTESSLLYGFDNITGNIVIPFFQHNINTQSSFATSCLSSTLANFLIILLKKNPKITLEGAMTIFMNKYLTKGRTKWIDDELQFHDGHILNMIDPKAFMEEELLYKSHIENALINSIDNEISLPNHATVFYEGAGVLFEIDGTKYEMTNETISILKTAVEMGKDVRWKFSRDCARKYGVFSDNYTLTAHLADNHGNIVEGCSLDNLEVTNGNRYSKIGNAKKLKYGSLWKNTLYGKW